MGNMNVNIDDSGVLGPKLKRQDLPVIFVDDSASNTVVNLPGRHGTPEGKCGVGRTGAVRVAGGLRKKDILGGL